MRLDQDLGRDLRRPARPPLRHGFRAALRTGARLFKRRPPLAAQRTGDQYKQRHSRLLQGRQAHGRDPRWELPDPDRRRVWTARPASRRPGRGRAHLMSGISIWAPSSLPFGMRH